MQKIELKGLSPDQVDQLLPEGEFREVHLPATAGGTDRIQATCECLKARDREQGREEV